MKRLLFLLLLLPSFLKAQITFNYSDYANWQPAATLDTHFRVSNLNQFQSIPLGANQTYDFTNLNYQSFNYYYARESFSDTAFPAATYRDSQFQHYIPGIAYTTLYPYVLDANGLRNPGQKIPTDQEKKIGNYLTMTIFYFFSKIYNTQRP